MNVSDLGWEARMAERARARQEQADALKRSNQEARAFAAFKEKAQRPWLNGWPRMGLHTVLIGTGTHCVCCGKFNGTTCVAFPPDWEPPGPDPAWPFSEDDCPLLASH